MQLAALLVLSLAAAVQGARLHHTQHGQMNPEAVAHILVQVEDKWMEQAKSYAKCNTSDAEGKTCTEGTMGEFVKSCKTVIGSMVQGSNGDKAVIKEYLDDVCGQGELQGWKQQLCGNLTQAVSTAMSADAYTNREDLNLEQICSSFMTHGFMKKAMEAEQAREEQERIREEKEAEEAKKRAEEEAKAEAAKAKAEEAQAKAEAAKQAAEEAAQKREEAQKEAAEAKRKQDEATEAEAKKHQMEAAANATVVEAAATQSNATAPVANMSSANATAAEPANTSSAPAPKNTSEPVAQAVSESNATATGNVSQPAAEAKQVKLVAVSVSNVPPSATAVSNKSKPAAMATGKNVSKPAGAFLVQQKKVMKHQ